MFIIKCTYRDDIIHGVRCLAEWHFIDGYGKTLDALKMLADHETHTNGDKSKATSFEIIEV